MCHAKYFADKVIYGTALGCTKNSTTGSKLFPLWSRACKGALWFVSQEPATEKTFSVCYLTLSGEISFFSMLLTCLFLLSKPMPVSVISLGEYSRYEKLFSLNSYRFYVQGTIVNPLKIILLLPSFMYPSTKNLILKWCEIVPKLAQ